MYFEKDVECMERAELEDLQLERLQATLNRVARNVPLYRQRFAELGLDPDDFRSMDDLRKLPFTTKQDIRENYPYGLFAVPLRDVVRLQSSSGTTGKPIVVGYTRNDLKRWSRLVARVLAMGGMTRDDVVQIAFHYGLFTGGFGLHYGAETLGASVIPSSGGNARKQIMIMQDYRTTALCCTPSYALHLADTMEEMGVNPNSLHLKWGLFGAEAWSEAMREEIQNRLKVTATDNYGISEVMGPGIAGECLERQGLHVNEDHFLFEIVHPETGEPVPDGEVGELVITTLTKEAFPMIRFRTGDLTRVLPDVCPCGRRFRRIARIIGRSDDMLIIRGVNVFPLQVETVLLAMEGAEPHYQIVLEREGRLDKATVFLEVSENLLFDRMRVAREALEGIKRKLASELGVAMDVVFVGRKTLERTEGKIRRVVDRRQL
ncbi:phenylacetate--CoA ligase family protein [Desulfovibrio subterraneus]|jgi:phenylacetate-CoA ligase|uniref:Phenylacetate-coenzyme A ligase n=1 Tax=Desulfovibrio subterraneus TaxID=2718620 RepID=A0A7J0BDZ5_9BACT|nr:phenylacetate--CoA ligase [Desulfovibrio subterraneus]GFM31907.1 phenylacetate-coenzyme A ligase [Desulfovibrio subterraneus]